MRAFLELVARQEKHVVPECASRLVGAQVQIPTLSLQGYFKHELAPTES